MRLEFFARAALFGAALALAGCSPLHKLTRIGGSCHDHKPYMSARSVPPLRVPPGLDPADTSNAMKIPVLNEPAPPSRSGNQPCLDEPPPFATPKKPAPQARSMIRGLAGEAVPG